MSGVSNQPGLPDVPRLLRTPSVSAAPAAPAVPAPAPLGTDQLALGGAPAPAPAPDASAQLAMLRDQIVTGSDVEAGMAIAQLESLAATHRDEVVQILTNQLFRGNAAIHITAALNVLQHMKAPEAAPYLQNLMQDSQPAVRAAAGQAYQAITGTPATPAAPAAPAAPSVASTPGAPAPGQPPAAPVDPSRPITGTPGAAPTTAPAPAANPAAAASTDALVQMLMDPSRAPAAAVQLTKLPIDQVLAVSKQIFDSRVVGPQAAELVATVLSKRMKEPGTIDMLRYLLHQDVSSHAAAAGKAALALLSTHNPAYTPDILRVLATMQVRLVGVKQVLIDQMAKDPRYLNYPATAAILGAVLHAQESDAVSASASHALGLIKSAQARDSLAANPLFKSPDPKLRMRALWDLGNQPAPYPPAAIENLQRLAGGDHDKAVKAKAEELLKRK